MFPPLGGRIGALSIRLGYRSISTYSRVRVRGLNRGAWNDQVLGGAPVHLPGDGDPNGIPDQLLDRPESIRTLVRNVVGVQHNQTRSRIDYLLFPPRQPGHFYVFGSPAANVPQWFRDALADRSNASPLRALVQSFPGGGGEMPRIPGLAPVPPGTLPVSSAMQTLLQITQECPLGRRAIDPVEGLVRLGPTFVQASRYQVLEDDQFVIRVVLMTTTPVHPFRGKALWIQAYEKALSQLYHIHVGAGDHPAWLMDRLNSQAAGPIFATTHNSFDAAMRFTQSVFGGQQILSPEQQAWPIDVVLDHVSPRLTAARFLIVVMLLLGMISLQMDEMPGVQVVEQGEGADAEAGLDLTVITEEPDNPDGDTPD